jgi:hypothetical protein
MMNPPMANDRALRESGVIERFLESPNEESFADLFRVFTPQLVAFFRSRGCELALSEDLTQEVMLTVYRKAAQVRDRSLFRAWLFKIARNALCRQYGKQSREVETVDLANVAGSLVASSNKPAGTCGIRVSRLDGFPGIKRARGFDLALCRGVGISRDRRCEKHPHRNGPVARFQRQEKVGSASEGPPDLQTRSGLKTPSRGDHGLLAVDAHLQRKRS